jgi:5'-nucleotidase
MDSNGSKKPLLLLANDDGIMAPGLAALVESTMDLGELAIFAPQHPRSGASHAVTLANPLRLLEQPFPPATFAAATDGTPADAVKLGLWLLKPRRPALVLSGINMGANTGVFIHYSGTVSAAREACLNGVPALAISLTTYVDPIFESAIFWANKVVKLLLDQKLNSQQLWNLNIPNLPLDEIKGLKITHQGSSILHDHYEQRTDPRQGKYYWLVDDGPTMDSDPISDEMAILEGYCSLTPLRWDLTDDRIMEALQHIPDRIGKQKNEE